MGWRGNLTAQEFHDFANVTQALIWQGVAAVMAARISIAESHQVCEQTRELLADLRRRRSEGRRGRAWRESVGRYARGFEGRHTGAADPCTSHRRRRRVCPTP